MSIIVTQINKNGIVFGSDSNITSDVKYKREGKKIFEIPKLNAGMCIAGTYEVSNRYMDEWLPEFINSNQDNYNSLHDFTKLLSERFTADMTKEEKAGLSISHIAGYNGGHPEMWCLSNTGLTQSGYSEGEEKFHYSEDFWNRDWGKNNLESAFKSDGYNYQIYVNSPTQGRIAFNVVRDYIDMYLVSMWANTSNKFRAPKNIGEHELFVKAYIELINTMYQISDYEPKIIGGKPQLFTIKNLN
jgi:hypothetical protein